MNPNEILKEMRKTTVELRRSNERQMELSNRGKFILRNQSIVLCKALQQLKKRSDLGQTLAGDIWDCMIDGITETLPPEFFANHGENYFWESDEVLTEDELALKNLLDQALQRKKEKANPEKKKVQMAMAAAACNTKKFASMKGGQPGHLCLFEGTPAILGASFKDMDPTQPKGKGKKGRQQKGRVQGVNVDPVAFGEGVLMGYLIRVIKVAIDTTNLNRWGWQKEDEELKAEMLIFHQGLKVAMQLFEEIHRNPNLESLISAVEKISMETATIAEDERVVPIPAARCGHCSDTTTSSSVPSCSSSDAGTYGTETDDDLDDDDDFDEDDEIVELALTPMMRPGKDRSKPCPGGTMASASAATAEVVDQPYVVRQYRSEEGKRKRRPIAFKCSPCDHIGCSKPPAHAKDWRKEGSWCNCGKKYATSKELDRHLTYSMESLVLSCNKCDFISNRRCCMDKHKKDTHEKLPLVKSSQRLYKCSLACGQVFESKKEMREHVSETGRQCVHMNAGKLPVKTLPTNPMIFMDMLKSTLERSGIELTPERLDSILTATHEDTRRAKLKQEETMKAKKSAEEKKGEKEKPSKGNGKSTKL